MKGTFFFKDNGKLVNIEEFDYDYVRNSLLKVFDKNVSKKYLFNVVVKRDYDTNGMPIFDVRSLDLNDIYYDNINLRVLEMMLDDIYFGRINVKDLPIPKLQKEYQDYLEGKIVKNLPSVSEISTPAPITYTRKEISLDDPRIQKISQMESSYPIDSLKVLDWIENFEVCSQEMTIKTQSLSQEQLNLVQILQTNSEYIHSVFNNLTTVLESLFPIKPNFMQKIFGKKDIVVEKNDLSTILNTLQNTIKVDPNRFTGINSVFETIQKNISEMKETVEHGIIGCTFIVSQNVDDQFVYEFELRQERLMKIRSTTDISEMSLNAVNKRFLTDLNKLKEIQDVVVPLLIVKLQNQATKKVDDETVDIIKKLAYRNDNESDIQPPPKNR